MPAYNLSLCVNISDLGHGVLCSALLAAVKVVMPGQSLTALCSPHWVWQACADSWGVRHSHSPPGAHTVTFSVLVMVIRLQAKNKNTTTCPGYWICSLHIHALHKSDSSLAVLHRYIVQVNLTPHSIHFNVAAMCIYKNTTYSETWKK